MIEHFELPLGSKGTYRDQKKEPIMSAFQAGFASSRLDEGKLGFFETVESKSKEELVLNYPDYNDNKEAYDSFLGIGDYTIGASAKKINDRKYQNAIRDNIYELDENNNLVEGSGYNVLAEMLFDRNAFKGYLLAQKNGLNDDAIQSKYQEIVKNKQKELTEAEEGLWSEMGGALVGYLASEETLSDFASPGKIMASTIGKGFIKAMGVEASYIAAGETMREMKRRDHALAMDEERTLWDSTKEILINAGFGGLIRGIGSAVWDAKTMRDIHKRIGQFADESDALTDKQIFSQFAQRENFKLHTNTQSHYRILDEAELQMEQGKKVDIAEALDIPIESKLETEETTNFIDELDKMPEVQQDKQFYQTLDNEVDNAMEDLNFYDDDFTSQYINDSRLISDDEALDIMNDIEELENALKE